MTERQQLLHLWLGGPSVDNPVLAWSFHDASAGEGPQPPPVEPPYATGLDAMRDGWMLLSATPPPTPQDDPNSPGTYIDHEFLFERRITGASTL